MPARLAGAGLPVVVTGQVVALQRDQPPLSRLRSVAPVGSRSLDQLAMEVVQVQDPDPVPRRWYVDRASAGYRPVADPRRSAALDRGPGRLPVVEGEERQVAEADAAWSTN